MKRLLILLLILSAAVCGHAQSGIPAPAWGISGGLNLSRMTSDEMDYYTRGGIRVGVFAEWGLGNGDFAIAPELVYSSQGMVSYKRDYDAQDGDLSMRINYLQLPIALKWYLGDKISIDAGVQGGYLLWVRGKYDNDMNGLLPRRKPGDEGFKTPSRTLFYGETLDWFFGISLLNYSNHWSLSFRCVYGLTPALRYDDSARSQNYQFIVGYAF